jgi:hypothetical protein
MNVLLLLLLQDMLTDACASCEPYQGGYAHWGMLQVQCSAGQCGCVWPCAFDSAAAVAVLGQCFA